jgi:hypothetical protein
MPDLYLVFVHFIGTDYEDNNIYEFLFANNPADIEGEDWDIEPANGNPKPPKEDILQVGKIMTNVKFDLAKESEAFDMSDCKDGVIALAWENILDYEEVVEDRLVFKYGEKIKSVDDKFYERDLTLKYKIEMTHV